MEIGLWKYCDETQFVLKEIDKAIQIKIQEITDFGGLITSPQLEREYCVAIGAIQALKEIKQLIEESNDGSKAESTKTFSR
jgi:hypothetical protein